MKYLLGIIFLTSCATSQQQADCIDKSKVRADAMCAQVYQPVCGCDGKTYSNDCVATNNGVSTWTKGECNSNASGK